MEKRSESRKATSMQPGRQMTRLMEMHAKTLEEAAEAFPALAPGEVAREGLGNGVHRSEPARSKLWQRQRPQWGQRHLWIAGLGKDAAA